MKARVKATGEIVDVDECGQTFKDMRMDYMDTRGRCYSSEDLDFTDNTPFDYWTRLEHQYAGMAILGMLSNEYTHKLYLDNKNYPNGLLNDSIKIAHALVEKMKEERE